MQSTTEYMVFHQDHVEELLRVFDSAFRIVVPGPGRMIVGLQSISEKQQGMPGWYLWFEDCPGAYLLELADASPIGILNDPSMRQREAMRGVYRIKYYPHVDDLSRMRCLSAAEQIFRRSGCFDQTGTPDFHEGEDIPESFFLTGIVETAVTADANGLTIRLGAPDRWITWAVDGLSSTDESGVAQILRKPGEKDRDVPTWEWSWFLLDRLIRVLCLGFHTIPRCVSFHEAPGQAFRVFKSGILSAVPEDSVRQRWLDVSFRLHEGHSSCPKLSETYPAEPMTLLDVPPGHLVASYCQEPSPSHPWIPSSWWHIRESPLDTANVLPC